MSRRTIFIGGVVLAVAVVGAFVVWALFLRGDAPPPVDLDSAVASISSPTATAEVTPASTSTTAATTTTDVTATATPAVDPADVPSWELVAADSFVGYRVVEELANIGANTAVGRTSSVGGSLVFDGTAIIGVDVVADLTQLESDDSRRDRQLRSRGIQTNDFPTATFTLTSPIEIDAVPGEGETIIATAVGDFTLHGITRSVEIPIEGVLSGGFVIIVGSLEVVFADYEIEGPTGRSMLSIEDQGVMEFQLVFAPA